MGCWTPWRLRDKDAELSVKIREESRNNILVLQLQYTNSSSYLKTCLVRRAISKYLANIRIFLSLMYDDMILNYSCSAPNYNLQNIQRYLGPLTLGSTHWFTRVMVYSVMVQRTNLHINSYQETVSTASLGTFTTCACNKF